MKVPFFDLKRQYQEIAKEVETAVREVMHSGQYIEGPETKKLEQELAQYIGVKHVISCGNGTDALRIALQASGVKAGDEVITTAFSFFATAEAIAQIGAIPVFVDIKRDDLNIDARILKDKINAKTKAILPVHIFGMPADMEEINEIGHRAGIPVIEDACQAIGAEYHKKKTGALGHVGCFSFYPTKNLGAFGDGGMITTDDDNIATICNAVKSHAAGQKGALAFRSLYHENVPELDELLDSGDFLYDPCKYYNYFIGGNSRLDSMQAAVLRVKLKYLDRYNAKRAQIARKYSEALSDLPIQVPIVERPDRKSCWHQYVILSDKKMELIAYMEANGVGTGTFYPIPLHLQKAFRTLKYQDNSLPQAEEVCRRSVCLPVFPELREEEQNYVIEVIHKFFR